MSAKTESLVKKLRRYSDAYYNGVPLIADSLFDGLMDRLKEMDPEHPFLKETGAPPPKAKVKLPFYMPSLDKIKAEDETGVKRWLSKFEGFILASDKIDGMSFSLYGQGGAWKMCSRGDGEHGQESSHLVPHLNLPKYIYKAKVRVELVMREDLFQEHYAADNKNSRNFVGGLINSNEPDPEALGRVSVIAHELICDPPISILEQMRQLDEMGFETPFWQCFKPNPSVKNLVDHYLERREKSPYKMDGLVVIPSDGVFPPAKNTDRPAHKMAFKMSLDEQTFITKVVGVEWNLAKSGNFRPRVKIEPTDIDGITVRHADGLHAAFIKTGYRTAKERKQGGKDMPLGPGAEIRIIRSGDVIPKIIEILKPASAPDFPDSYQWTSDVHIGPATVSEDDKALLRQKRILHFFRTIGAEHFSDKYVARFYENGFNSIVRLLKAKPDDFLVIPGIKEAMAEKLYASIRSAAEKATMSQTMHASGCFPDVLGEKKLRQIIKHNPDFLEKIPVNIPFGIGSPTFAVFLQNLPKFRKFYEKIEKHVNAVMPASDPENAGDFPLVGLKFVFTGFRDKGYEEKIREAGGEVVGSVSSKVTCLIYKSDGPLSEKVKKAQSLNVFILERQEFADLISKPDELREKLVS